MGWTGRWRRAGLALAVGLAVVGLGGPARGQYAPYRERLFEQARRDGQRQIDGFLDQAYRPNPGTSGADAAIAGYLSNLRARAEAERQERAERRAMAAYEAARREEWWRQQQAEREAAEREAQRQADVAEWTSYKRRAEAGDAQASHAIGLTLLKGSSRLPAGEVTGWAGATPWFRQAARQGSAGAAMQLAAHLERLAPAGRPPREAYDLYRRAAELGRMDAVPRAAAMAESGGDGFGPDRDEAWRLLQLGAERRHVESMRDAALFLQRKEKPTPVELGQAMRWLEAAAPTDPVAAGRLALMTYWGKLGMPEDRGRAVALARRALAQAPTLYPLDELLAQALMYGHGGERKDPAEAVFRLRRAATNGVVSAASLLALWLETGASGAPRAREEALRWRERAARQGSVRDAVSLAKDAWFGADRNVGRAVEFYELAAAAGDGEAAYQLARLRARGTDGIPRDLRGSRQFARQSAEASDAMGMALFGSYCLEGVGGPEDLKGAAFWLKASAERGVAFAQRLYGGMLMRGQGVSRDQPAAVAWLRRSAAGGDGDAMAEMATLLIEGALVPKDLGEARRLAVRSAELGSPLGQRLWAEFLRHGRGGAVDGPEAVNWYRKARDRGDAASMLALGEVFRDGLPGVAPDAMLARDYFGQASRAGDPEIASAAAAALRAMAPSGVGSLESLKIRRPATTSIFESLSLRPSASPTPSAPAPSAPRGDEAR